MWKRNGMFVGMLRSALVVSVGMCLAGVAAAGEIYSWRTDDGDVAFTDNVKNVPPRYRDQAEVRKMKPLGDYARLSSQEANGTQRYQQQLAARLDHLRALNAQLVREPADRNDAVGTATLQINGSNQMVSLNGATNEPVIVERVRVRRVGQIVSRHDTVVRQGNRTLAILRGNQEGELGGASSIHNEDDLELYR